MTTTGDCSTGACAFVIVTRDVTSSHSRTLTVHETEPYTAVQAGVLEAYQISASSDLPATTLTNFTRVVVDEPSGPVTPAWTPRIWSASPSCGYGVTSSGSTVLAEVLTALVQPCVARAYVITRWIQHGSLSAFS
jgi:hypothetical protein